MDNFHIKFFEDAQDLVANMEQALLQFASEGKEQSLLETLLRDMHTIKGGANMFGIRYVGELAHQLESIYEELLAKAIKVDDELVDFSLSSIDILRKTLHDPDLKDPEHEQNYSAHFKKIEKVSLELLNKAVGADPSFQNLENPAAQPTYCIVLKALEAGDLSQDVAYLAEELKGIGWCETIRTETPAEGAQTLTWYVLSATEQGKDAVEGIFLFSDDQFEITIEELSADNLLSKPAFFQAVKDSAAQNALTLENLLLLAGKHSQLAENTENDPDNSSKDAKEGQKKQSFKIDQQKVQQMMNQVSELVTMQNTLKLISKKHALSELANTVEKIDLIVNSLRETVYGISLLPLDTLHTQFQRLVRDLARTLGKEIEFLTEGTDTEIDKSIIDQLAEPLLHIFRNSLDHGLERPDERIEAGKGPKGTIRLKAFYSGQHVVIQIKDDGRGIDPDKVREKALEKGLISPDDELSREQIIELIFAPGFSTASQLTDISGRGVGMDIVQKRIEALKGRLNVETEKGKGTEFTIKLPLSMSIIDGLLIQVADRFLIIPVQSVHKCYRISREAIENSRQFNTSLLLEGKNISCIHLRTKLEISGESPRHFTIISVLHQGREIGIIADAVIGEQQVVLKPLGKLYNQQEALSGAAVLGDGAVALALDTEKLIQQHLNYKQ